MLLGDLFFFLLKLLLLFVKIKIRDPEQIFF